MAVQTDSKHTIQQNRRSYTNYRKADWDKFTQDTNKTFTNILYQAGKQHIPVCKIRNTYKLLPYPIRNKIAHRYITSKNTPQDPTIPELNKEISTLINTNKTDIWREHRRNTSIYWNTIHGLAHKRPNTT